MEFPTIQRPVPLETANNFSGGTQNNIEQQKQDLEEAINCINQSGKDHAGVLNRIGQQLQFSSENELALTIFRRAISACRQTDGDCCHYAKAIHYISTINLNEAKEKLTSLEHSYPSCTILAEYIRNYAQKGSKIHSVRGKRQITTELPVMHVLLQTLTWPTFFKL